MGVGGWGMCMEGVCMMGSMHGMGTCVAGRDMHDRGCVAGGV